MTEHFFQTSYFYFPDSECGHGRCFECMFRYSECPICLNRYRNIDTIGRYQMMKRNDDDKENSNLHLPNSSITSQKAFSHDPFATKPSNFASIHNRGCSRRSNNVVPRISAFSKESGFQSSYSSASSVCSGSRVSKMSNKQLDYVSILNK